MTYEEALIHAQKEVDAYALKIKNGANYYQKIADYYKLVCKALRKQIPMKPTTKCKCANCGRTVVGSGEYCWNCGQKIDWSEEHDLQRI